MTIEILFWSAVVIVAYTYAGFPLLVLLRGWLMPRPLALPRTAASEDEALPNVSLIIAAHNEAESIAAKLDSMVAMDYPAGRWEVLVASDGSTDATEEIVQRYAGHGVRLLALPRRGKAWAINAAVAVAEGDVLVFSDANSLFERQAVRNLVRPFADPTVGGVAGDQRYLPATGATSDCGERSYWNFDRLLKRAESRAGQVISATGAIYAIRRGLFREVPEGVTDDFITSTRVIAAGYRLVFCEQAVAWEPAADSPQVEFGRKVRVITRGLRGVLRMRELLNPLRFGFYSLQLLSHKLLRRLMFIPLPVLWIAAFWLWDEGLVYRAAGTAQTIFYLLAVCGGIAVWRDRRTSKLIAITAYFCMVNLASLVACWRLVGGHSVVLWEPQRQTAPDSKTPRESAPALPRATAGSGEILSPNSNVL